MFRIREDWLEADRLIFAAQDGDLPEVQRLAAEGFDVNLLDEIGRGALHYATESGHYEIVRWLLENGANVDLHDEDTIGETALAFAVKCGLPELVELLLKHGANPDIPGWMQNTARTRARERKRPVGLKIAALIEKYKPLPPNPLPKPEVKRRR